MAEPVVRMLFKVLAPWPATRVLAPPPRLLETLSI